MNNALKPNDLIQIGNNTYTIEKALNRGSSFITYIANSSNGVPYIIKEYFPISDDELKREFEDGVCVGITGLKHNKKKEVIEKKISIYKEIQKHKSRDGKYELINYIAGDIDVINFALNNDYFVVMYNQGDSVEDYINSNKHSIIDLLDLLKLIASICEDFYQCRYICIDLKPDNLLYDDKNNKTLKFIDFDSFIKVGKVKHIFTSAGYAPPEYYNDEDFIADEKSIVYCLGVILFKMFFPTSFKEYINRKATFLHGQYIEMPVRFVSDNPDVCFRIVPETFGRQFEKLEISKDNKGNLESISLDGTTKSLLFDIWKQSINPDRKQRYQTINEFIIDIEELENLIQNKGLSPRVILKNIIAQKELEKNTYIIDEDLLTGIKPIDS